MTQLWEKQRKDAKLEVQLQSAAQRDHQVKCSEEENLRNMKMDEVSQMEKLEMELIKRLQNT